MRVGAPPQQTKDQLPSTLSSANGGCLPSQRLRLPPAAYSWTKRANGYAPKRNHRERTGRYGKAAPSSKGARFTNSHLFTVKDGRFKSEPFLWGGKRDLYRPYQSAYLDPEQQLKVFDQDSVYLPTKKIGRTIPKPPRLKRIM